MYQLQINVIAINWNWHGINDTEFDNQTKIPCLYIDTELGKRKWHGRNDATLGAIHKWHHKKSGAALLWSPVPII